MTGWIGLDQTLDLTFLFYVPMSVLGDTRYVSHLTGLFEAYVPVDFRVYGPFDNVESTPARVRLDMVRNRMGETVSDPLGALFQTGKQGLYLPFRALFGEPEEEE
jgi:hypothetical protein